MGGRQLHHGWPTLARSPRPAFSADFWRPTRRPGGVARRNLRCMRKLRENTKLVVVTAIVTAFTITGAASAVTYINGRYIESHTVSVTALTPGAVTALNRSYVGIRAHLRAPYTATIPSDKNITIPLVGATWTQAPNQVDSLTVPMTLTYSTAASTAQCSDSSKGIYGAAVVALELDGKYGGGTSLPLTGGTRSAVTLGSGTGSGTVLPDSGVRRTHSLTLVLNVHCPTQTNSQTITLYHFQADGIVTD